MDGPAHTWGEGTIVRDGYYDLGSGAMIDLMQPRADDQMAMVTRIKVPPKMRGLGHARRLMAKLLQDADEEGVALVLAVEAYDGGLTNEQLIDWYQRMGFEWISEQSVKFLVGGNVEPGNGQVMIRQPRRE